MDEKARFWKAEITSNEPSATLRALKSCAEAVVCDEKTPVHGFKLQWEADRIVISLNCDPQRTSWLNNHIKVDGKPLVAREAWQSSSKDEWSALRASGQSLNTYWEKLSSPKATATPKRLREEEDTQIELKELIESIFDGAHLRKDLLQSIERTREVVQAMDIFAPTATDAGARGELLAALDNFLASAQEIRRGSPRSLASSWGQLGRDVNDKISKFFGKLRWDAVYETSCQEMDLAMAALFAIDTALRTDASQARGSPSSLDVLIFCCHDLGPGIPVLAKAMHEAQRVANHFARAQKTHLIIPGGSAEDLRAALVKHQPYMFLFIGHADLESSRGDPSWTPGERTLALPGASGQPELIEPDVLIDICCSNKRLKLVVLNGCKSSKMCERLSQRGVDAVGWETKAMDKPAMLFSTAFFERLLQGRLDDIEEAFEQGQLAVKAHTVPGGDGLARPAYDIADPESSPRGRTPEGKWAAGKPVYCSSKGQGPGHTQGHTRSEPSSSRALAVTILLVVTLTLAALGHRANSQSHTVCTFRNDIFAPKEGWVCNHPYVGRMMRVFHTDYSQSYDTRIEAVLPAPEGDGLPLFGSFAQEDEDGNRDPQEHPREQVDEFIDAFDKGLTSVHDWAEEGHRFVDGGGKRGIVYRSGIVCRGTLQKFSSHGGGRGPSFLFDIDEDVELDEGLNLEGSKLLLTFEQAKAARQAFRLSGSKQEL